METLISVSSYKVQKISKGLPKTVQAFIAKKKFTVEGDSAVSEIKRDEIFHLYTVGSKFYFVDTEGDEYHIFQIAQDLFMRLKYTNNETGYRPGRLGQLHAKLQSNRKKVAREIRLTTKLRKSIEEDIDRNSTILTQSEHIYNLNNYILKQKFNKNLQAFRRVMAQLKLYRQYRIEPREHTDGFLDEFIDAWNTMIDLRDAGKDEEVASHLAKQIDLLEEKWDVDFDDNPIQHLQERYGAPAPVYDINKLRPKTQGPKKPITGNKILEFKEFDD